MTLPLDPTSPFARMPQPELGSRIGRTHRRPNGGTTTSTDGSDRALPDLLSGLVKRLTGVSRSARPSGMQADRPRVGSRSLTVVPTFDNRGAECANAGRNEGGSGMTGRSMHGQKRYLMAVPTI